jgi:hypothetical protein
MVNWSMSWTERLQPGRTRWSTESVERKLARRFARHRTFLVGLLYVITIIVVLMIVSRL